MEIEERIAQDIGELLFGEDLGQEFGYRYDEGLIVQEYTEDGTIAKTYKVTLNVEEIK